MTTTERMTIERLIDEHPPVAYPEIMTLDAEGYIRDIYWRAQHSPDTLTEPEVEYLRDQLRAMAEVVTDALQAITAVFANVGTAVAELFRTMSEIDWLPPKAQRRIRKTQQIADHKARVAARVPAWKRAQ